MTLVLGAAGGSGLLFAADSKVQMQNPADGSFKTVVASRVAVYPLRGGILGIGYAGMWAPSTSDDLFLDRVSVPHACQPRVASPETAP